MHLINYNKNAQEALNKLVSTINTFWMDDITRDFNLVIHEKRHLSKLGRIQFNMSFSTI